MLQKYLYHCIDSCDDENDKLRNLRCNTTQMLMLTWNKLSEFVAKRLSQTDLGCWLIYFGITRWQLKYFYFQPDPWGFMIQFDLRIFFRRVGKNPPPRSYHIYNFFWGVAGWHPGSHSTEGADELRDLAMLSSLASMGHWEVALQCLSFPSRPGHGGGLVVWWCRKLDSREVLGVTVSCLLYKVLFNETQGLFFKGVVTVIFPSLDFFPKKPSHHGITIMRDWDISFPWLGWIDGFENFSSNDVLFIQGKICFFC